MEGITRVLFILVGFNLDWLSGTCIYQTYTKQNFTIKCATDAFVVEGVNSMMHCAYRCQRDEDCIVFQHSMTTKKCMWCNDFEMVNEQLSDTAVYDRILTVTPNDERDAVCITFCEADLHDYCFAKTFSFGVLRNETCLETCKDLFGVDKETYQVENNYCLCGSEDTPIELNGICEEVCRKQGRVCGERVLHFYKYMVGC